jgi:putative glycosyltransferase (TIGR04372 family)
MGLNPNQPFVCLIVRDSGHNADPSGVENPGYEFRNFDIDTFSDAAIALSKRGYQVVRMGAGKEKAFSLKHEGVFDYATSIHRTELLDIYLAANCAFAISTQTGPDAVCLLFRRPVCFVDIPVFSQFFFGTGLAFWNPTVYMQRDRKLSLREIIDADLLWVKSTDELLARQIEGVRSTPLEIQQNVMGFVEMYESGFVLTEEQEVVLDEVNLIIGSGMGHEGETVFGHILARLNPPFLIRNAEWFLR